MSNSPKIIWQIEHCLRNISMKVVILFVLRFYGPVNPIGSCRARSVYLTTRLLGRLSFWSMDHTHFSNLSFSCPLRLHMKFEQHWLRSFRGKAIWNYQHFFHTNVWGPYKCIQKQTWPCRKKVKCQCMTIILATLVDRPFQMIYAKIQLQAIVGFGE